MSEGCSHWKSGNCAVLPLGRTVACSCEDADETTCAVWRFERQCSSHATLGEALDGVIQEAVNHLSPEARAQQADMLEAWQAHREPDSRSDIGGDVADAAGSSLHATRAGRLIDARSTLQLAENAVTLASKAAGPAHGVVPPGLRAIARDTAPKAVDVAAEQLDLARLAAVENGDLQTAHIIAFLKRQVHQRDLSSKPARVGGGCVLLVLGVCPLLLCVAHAWRL